jgi:molybdate transport system substrate-binding protein
MLHHRLIVALGVLCLSACTAAPNDASAPAPETTTVTVFAASSLTDAFDEIAAEFEAQHSSVDVVINYASSSQLATQINEGAPADVFASASLKQMQVVQDAGNIIASPAMFATNRLVVITPAANPAVTSLNDLTKSGLRIVLAAPGVPIRDYTDQMLAAIAADAAYGQEYADAVYANVVSEEENVRQVVAKVALGEADAAVVYASDVTPDLAEQVTQIDVPDVYNVLAEYPIAVTKDAPERAQQFVDFVLSEAGQSILAQWGFGSASGE